MLCTRTQCVDVRKLSSQCWCCFSLASALRQSSQTPTQLSRMSVALFRVVFPVVFVELLQQWSQAQGALCGGAGGWLRVRCGVTEGTPGQWLTVGGVGADTHCINRTLHIMPALLLTITLRITPPTNQPTHPPTNQPTRPTTTGMCPSTPTQLNCQAMSTVTMQPVVPASSAPPTATYRGPDLQQQWGQTASVWDPCSRPTRRWWA